MSDALAQLLEPAGAGGRACAVAAREALVADGQALGRWLAAPLLGRTETAIDLAPVAALESLAERAVASGRGLERLAAARPGHPGGASILARALEHAVGRGLADPDELAAALQARRDERHLGHHTDRRAYAEHHTRRGAP
ncbi:MAG: hypothetical protein AAFZ65_19480, partial [Planctomycetota bacterium]